MPCSDTHFIPILDEIRARPDPEAPTEDHEPISENLCQSVADKGRNWGGRRPGAGAPKGNLNSFRHDRNSRPHQQMAEALARIPEFQKALVAIGKHRRQKQRQAETGTAVMLAELLRRVGESILHPEANQLEPNQEFLEFLRSYEARIREILEMQSSLNPQDSGPIKPAGKNPDVSVRIDPPSTKAVPPPRRRSP